MTWQFIIVAQILVSSVMTVFTRHLTLANKKVFFGIGVMSYVAVAVAGWIYATVFSGINLPLPPSNVWPYLIVEGLFIPAAWLVQYKLITHVGAGNAVIVTTLNTLSTAVLGIVLLHEGLTPSFAIGAVLVLGGVMIALGLKPDSKHSDTLGLWNKLFLTLLGAGLFAVGMFAEKVAVTTIGVWDYAAYGWSMQAIGAIVLYILFGRKESAHITQKLAVKGLMLGILTSIAGGLYIYALSMGTLSQTIVATSGKAVVVMLLAALLLRERNALGYKLIAFCLTVSGLWLVLM